MSSKFRKLFKVLPNVFMVLGAMSVAFAMLLSMVNLPASADTPENSSGEQEEDKHCPDGWIYKTGEDQQIPEGLTIDVNGQTVTFNKTVEFCVKAATKNSGRLTGESYTVDFLNGGEQFPDISYYIAS